MKIISWRTWKSFKSYPHQGEIIINGRVAKFTNHNRREADSPEQYRKRKNNILSVSIFGKHLIDIHYRDRNLPEYCTNNPFKPPVVI